MGSGESTTRKVSYGVDDEDRVRILRGVKLSEDVLQRMRGVANISQSSGLQKDKGSSPGSGSASQSKQNQHRAQSSKPASNAKEEQRRFERQQAILKDELAKIAQREKQLANEKTKASVQERQHTRQESEKTKQLVLQLQKKDLQLKALEAFYQEQLDQLEKKNLERYEESKEKFHQAASITEANIRSCSTAPVCSGLQAQILSCYRDNRDQTLKCSDLAKEYMQCINAAKKFSFRRKVQRWQNSS
ncbi:MICOS complex subunit mic25a isoform X3 [Oryzias melastigma]|uniref:Coiled-coil-helix-coiled-coil-helix domain containing 6a n=1 Tax=Oryzias melastigma TaxID=30732 RepID=A0A3B3DKM8_ORYME|nr:MICOS complex subunit mic25a isoform X3 [Oryzias melastigma]